MPKKLDTKPGRPTDVAKRQAIIEAAARSFFSHGFAASSIEQIAQEANVSKVTIYNHFGGKRALLSAAVEHECDKMRGYFAIEGLEGKTVRERLTAIGEGMVTFLSRREMVQFERRIAAETEQDPEIGLAFLEAGPRRMKQSFVAFIEWAQERGDLEVPEPWLAAEQFASMCKGLAISNDALVRRSMPISTDNESQALSTCFWLPIPPKPIDNVQHTVRKLAPVIT